MLTPLYHLGYLISYPLVQYIGLQLTTPAPVLGASNNHRVLLAIVPAFLNFLAAGALHYRGGYFPRHPVEVRTLPELFVRQWFTMLAANVMSCVLLVPFLTPEIWKWFRTSTECGLAVAAIFLLAPTGAHIFGFLGDFVLLRGRTDTTQPAEGSRPAPDLAPDEAESSRRVDLLEGLAAVARGDKPEALRHLSKAYNLGLMAQPDLAERAEKELEKLGVEPELCGTISFTVGASDGAHVIDAVRAYHDFDYDRAIGCLDRAVAADPHNRNALRYRAYVLTVKRRWEDAIRDFTALIQMEPFANNYYDRGKGFFGAQQYPEAIADFTNVIDLDGTPNQLRGCAYYNRGSAHLGKGSYAAAVDDFTDALNLSGADPAAFFFRGEAYKALRQIELARKDFNQAITYSTQSVTRARAQQALHDVEKVP